MRLDGPDVDRSRRWRISSFCSSGTCVAISFSDNSVLLTDTKLAKPEQASAAISIPADHWSEFLTAVDGDSGEIHVADILVERQPTGRRVSAVDGGGLGFSDMEWSAFRQGVKAGEFSHPL